MKKILVSNMTDFFSLRNFKIIIVFQVIAVSMFFGCAMAEKSPAQIVADYCQLDAKGYRLSSKGYEEIQRLMIQNEDMAEPGWDCFKIISSYKVVDTEILGDKAKVKVNYLIAAEYCVGDEVKRKTSTESFVFKLLKTDEGWKIENYVPFPRLFKAAAMRVLEGEASGK